MKSKILFLLALSIFISSKTFAQKALADSLFKAQQWEKAAAIYQKYTDANPNDIPGYYWNRIGQCYNGMLQFDLAVTSYEKAVKYNNNPSIMYNIACAYSRLSKKDSAITWLQRSADAGFNLYDQVLKDADLLMIANEPKFKTVVDQIKKNAMPCSVQPESRLFDFWAGNWKVYNPQGQQAGTSSVQKILGECVIFENWTDYFGNTGKSFNVYNSSTKEWQQTWVDDKGTVTEFINGKYSDGAMRFATSRPQIVKDKKVYRRLTFFNISADQVRQLGEVSNDNGKNWKTEYDLKYIRVKE